MIENLNQQDSYRVTFEKIGNGFSKKNLLTIQQIILQANQQYPLPYYQQEIVDISIQTQTQHKQRKHINQKRPELPFDIGYQKQSKFIKFHLEQNFGKHFQVLIFGDIQQNGHCLYASEQMFGIIRFQANIYILWKVNLVV